MEQGGRRGRWRRYGCSGRNPPSQRDYRTPRCGTRRAYLKGQPVNSARPPVPRRQSAWIYESVANWERLAGAIFQVVRLNEVKAMTDWRWLRQIILRLRTLNRGCRRAARHAARGAEYLGQRYR